MGKEKGLVNPAVKDRCTATGFISEVHLYPYLHGEKVDRPFGGFFFKRGAGTHKCSGGNHGQNDANIISY